MIHKTVIAILLVFVACTKRKIKPAEDLPLNDEQPFAYLSGLPSGLSPITEIDGEVRGNSVTTDYQYALLQDKNISCVDADYGEFQKITERLKITLGNDGDQIICLRGKGNDQLQKNIERYQWVKIPKLLSISTLPIAYASGLPNGESHLSQITASIAGLNGATKYQYVLLDQENANCNNIDDRDYQKNEQTITTPLSLQVTSIGAKTLCVRGIDKNGKIQEDVAKYCWTQTTPSPPVTETASGKSQLHLNRTKININSGSRNYYTIIIANKGTKQLRWRAQTSQAISWLKIRKHGGSYKVANKSQNLITGTLPARTTSNSNNSGSGSSTYSTSKIFFKLNNETKTNYGTPYLRKNKIRFYNTDSNWYRDVEITLKIPKLRSAGGTMRFSNNTKTSRIPIENVGEQSAQLQTKYLAVVTDRNNYNKFIKTIRVGFEKISGKLSFKASRYGNNNSNGIQQKYLIYSNGDSKGVNNCKIEANKVYHNSFSPPWDTTNCISVTIAIDKDNNNDNGN